MITIYKYDVTGISTDFTVNCNKKFFATDISIRTTSLLISPSWESLNPTVLNPNATIAQDCHTLQANPYCTYINIDISQANDERIIVFYVWY